MGVGGGSFIYQATQFLQDNQSYLCVYKPVSLSLSTRQVPGAGPPGNYAKSMWKARR